MHRELKLYEIGSYMGDLQYLGDCPKEDWKWDTRTSMFRCVCGKVYSTSLSKVKNGGSSSCGCVTKAKTHGMSGTRQYKVWLSMKRRCDNPTSEFFHIYGGRGITYCEEWEKFENFWKDMNNGYEDHLEIDRIDPDGNYFKENCRWVDEGLQNYNRRITERNTTGKVGVYFYKKTGKWQARISKDNIDYYLGIFDSFELACKARELAELEYYGFNVNKEQTK
jgi:hypothetical protein